MNANSGTVARAHERETTKENLHLWQSSAQAHAHARTHAHVWTRTCANAAGRRLHARAPQNNARARAHARVHMPTRLHDRARSHACAFRTRKRSTHTHSRTRSHAHALADTCARELASAGSGASLRTRAWQVQGPVRAEKRIQKSVCRQMMRICNVYQPPLTLFTV
eukprot:5757830-Pleurochrysis_carterae.AAC.1